MKFIKYAVGLVIALSVIPMVVVAVTKLDEPRLKTVAFEVVDVDNGTITFSENTYTALYNVIKINDDTVTNLITTRLNGSTFVGFDVILEFSNDTNDFTLLTDGTYDWEDLNELNQADSVGYSATIGDKWQMTFEVPSPPIPPLVKLLVGFAPLLFVGGILLFMLNKRKLA